MKSDIEARLDRRIKGFLVCFLMCATSRKFGALGILRCEREQSSLINQEKALDCTIIGRYYGVYWYIGDSRDSIIRYINGLKAGSEYQNGRLDIAPNGSMIIKNVGVNDEKTYRIMVVWSEGGDDSAYVHLTVIVPSSTDIPEIDRCNGTSKKCRLCTFQSVPLECSMDGRPPVDLQWFDETSELLLDGFMWTKSSNLATFESISRINVHLDYLEIKEVSCLSSGLAVTRPDRIVRNASVLLISPSDPYSSFNKTHYFPSPNSSDRIGQNISNTVAWIKQTANVDYSNKLTTCKALEWSEHGELILQLEDGFEGIYTQIVRNDDGTYSRNVHEVLLAKAPKSLLFIKECSSQGSQNCSIYVNGTGTLTCSVNGARPTGSIKWNVPRPGALDIYPLSSSFTCGHDSCSTSSVISFQFTNSQTEVGELECIINGPWNGFPKTVVVQLFNEQYLTIPSSSTFSPMESASSNAQTEGSSTAITIIASQATGEEEKARTDSALKISSTILTIGFALVFVLIL